MSQVISKVILLLLIILIPIVITTTAFAGYPDSYTLYDKFIDKTSTKSYDVYFPYGNQYLTKELNDIAVELKLNKESLYIDPNNVFDYYFTDDLVNGNLNFPKNKVMDCSLIPKYKDVNTQKDKVLTGNKIPQEIVTKNGIKSYKPQNNNEKNLLKAGTTGCIGVTVYVLPTASKAGEVVELVFNPNINYSKSYEEAQRPGIITVAFIITDNEKRCDVNKGELFINDKCRQRCENNQTVNANNGECEFRKRPCNNTFEDDVNGVCLQKCPVGYNREQSGLCKDPKAPKPIEQFLIYSKNNLIPYIIFSSVVTLASILALFAINRKNRKK
jgi:hypothetical protein